jgi:NADPH:quinone reductase-like Zn-dependent oxidoreductase
MKAIVYREYGSPDVLRYEEIEKPTPGDNEVLVRVRGAALNPLDWHFMRGSPYGIRLMSGLGKPKDRRLGMDVAGVVEAAGKDVKDLKAGDEVFGFCRGAFAEYACGPESGFAPKPANVTFEQAGCVGVAAITALQGLRDKGRVQPGQKILINGASGGVGTLAVQVGKWLGAEVTAVCSTRNVEMVRFLGAHRVIDYTQQDFTRGEPRYDVIFDCIGNHSLRACRRVLNRSGIYIMVGAPTGRWVAPMDRVLRIRILSWFVSQTLSSIMAKSNKDDLKVVSDLTRTGKITPVIDRRYGLQEVPAAMRYLEEGHARGKVVITLEPSDSIP